MQQSQDRGERWMERGPCASQHRSAYTGSLTHQLLSSLSDTTMISPVRNVSSSSQSASQS